MEELTDEEFEMIHESIQNDVEPSEIILRNVSMNYQSLLHTALIQDALNARNAYVPFLINRGLNIFGSEGGDNHHHMMAYNIEDAYQQGGVDEVNANILAFRLLIRYYKAFGNVNFLFTRNSNGNNVLDLCNHPQVAMIYNEELNIIRNQVLALVRGRLGNYRGILHNVYTFLS